MLKLPDLNKRFILMIISSDVRIGVISSQRDATLGLLFTIASVSNIFDNEHTTTVLQSTIIYVLYMGILVL